MRLSVYNFIENAYTTDYSFIDICIFVIQQHHVSLSFLCLTVIENAYTTDYSFIDICIFVIQ